ncbi:ZIP family metal transporter [SCandidatus Aminicenantes bacterium Aminicenantia_JdfR_composite]|jgi:ZIP family zinc transporter|nr:ZIP family metal transporter [SCandidatus Aminicenantes bacterium Aminicenantia_JdfR_composite]MCP2620765.1 ZIP family metal transporter [Candidatus Aminicenantes bacterium AC-334-E05]
MSEFSSLPPTIQALFATLFTWFITALGAGVVFLRREFSRKLLDASLGFSAGIMISASFFSLLLPAIDIASEGNLPRWIPVSIGFLIGGLFLKFIDSIIPHLHLFLPIKKSEGIKSKFSKTTLLMFAVTIHNFPEGIAIGVAFGSVALLKTSTFMAAIALTIGIAIQNFPEGMAVSLPLLREGHSRFKSFWYGQLSAMVEPLGAVMGASLVIMSKKLLPYALTFAAGAMIYVVIEELIPESQTGGNVDIATVSAILGFTIMMILDVALG